MFLGLLTWTVYGTWLPGPARGWIDPGSVLRDEELPEPDLERSVQRRRSLQWPALTLDEQQRTSLVEEMQRIALLRDFQGRVIVVADDHAHLLLETRRSDLQRVVQLIKGASSRRLTVLAGDRAAASTSGTPLAFHKWWTRQYSLRGTEDRQIAQAVRRRLESHPPPVSIWASSEE